MSNAESYAPVAKTVAAIIAVLGGWLVVAPFVLPGATFAVTHVVVGLVVTAVAGGYLVQLHRRPETKLASIWFVLVLGVLVLTGALLSPAPGELFFWSTVLTSTLIVLLAMVSIVWGSRFAAGAGLETTLFQR